MNGPQGRESHAKDGLRRWTSPPLHTARLATSVTSSHPLSFLRARSPAQPHALRALYTSPPSCLHPTLCSFSSLVRPPTYPPLTIHHAKPYFLLRVGRNARRLDQTTQAISLTASPESTPP